MRTVGIVGVSGKLGRHLATQAIERGYEVVGVCREQSMHKVSDLADRITLIPGRTDDPTAARRALPSCDGVLTVLVPWGVEHYASGTARAVLEHSKPGARLIFSCGWHVPGHPLDRYPRTRVLAQSAMTRLLRAARIMDIDDQVAAARLVYASDTRWTVVRASTLQDGEPEGLPVRADYVGHPKLASDRTRRADYAHFMLEALDDESLVHRAPAIVGRLTPSAIAHGDEP